MIQRRKPLARSTKPIRRSPIKRTAKILKFKKPHVLEREKEERRAEREEQKKRDACRFVVFMRAHGRCERCSKPLVLLPKNARHEFEIGNVHEEPPRSQGGDPTNPDECVLLCCACHDLRTGNKIQVVIVSVGNQDGSGRVIEFPAGSRKKGVINGA